MNNIVILGAGQIGQAAFTLVRMQSYSRTTGIPKILSDTFAPEDRRTTFFDTTVHLWDLKQSDNVTYVIDLNNKSDEEISSELLQVNATHVINALPFYLNTKIAKAAVKANCSYIDFTEDDNQAKSVQEIYAGTGLTCAVKCGLAPGFINYVAYDLSKKIHKPEKLMICVGALPRSVSFVKGDEANNYSLSWSVDGLVNEYIRPCKVKMNGTQLQIPALTGLETVIIDGVTYEAAFTSGGIGSLVEDLKHVPDVYYKTLRYPGHYKYVADAVSRHFGNFDAIKKEFLSIFPFNKNDMVVVHTECTGKMNDSSLRKESFSQVFKGINGLSAIQTTTAGGGIIILEMMIAKQISGIVNHTNIEIQKFMKTETYKLTYSKA